MKQANESIIPALPWHRGEGATRRQIVCWMLLPILAGLIMIVVSFRIMALELPVYKPVHLSAPLFGIGILLFAPGIALLANSILGRLWRYNRWSLQPAQGSVRMTRFDTCLLAVDLVMLVSGSFALGMINDRIELQALEKDGVISMFRIEGSSVSRGRNSTTYYSHFSVCDTAGRLHKLSVGRNTPSELEVGDSVLICYMPGNPVYFREIQPDGRNRAPDLLP